MLRFASFALAVTLGTSAIAEAVKNPLTPEGSWRDLKDDIVGDVAITDGAPLFTLDAPYRAHDAAVVPIVIEQIDDSQTISSMDLVVDENPAPLVANISFGPAMHPVSFETRVRVNLYSNVRAVVQTEAGHFMNGRFVKASGGCSAPATRDPEEALAGMGNMRMRFFDDDKPKMSGTRQEAQIMLRHPNYSGLQRNQITQLFIPAHFIDTLTIKQGDEVLFTMTGGISISENPVFRFKYTATGEELTVEATDTQGNVFKDQFEGGA